MSIEETRLVTVRDIAGYKPNLDLPTTKRFAEYLHWAAVNHPKKASPWTIAARAVFSFGYTPGKRAKEVSTLHSCVTRMAEYLFQATKLSVISDRKYGIRATASATDKKNTTVVRRTNQLTRSAYLYEREVKSVDLKQLSAADRADMEGYLSVCKSLPLLREKLLLSAGRDPDGKLLKPEASK